MINNNKNNEASRNDKSNKISNKNLNQNELSLDTKIQMIKDYTHDVSVIYKNEQATINADAAHDMMLEEKLTYFNIMDNIIVNTINLFPEAFGSVFAFTNNQFILNSDINVDTKINRELILASVLRQHIPLLHGKYIPEYCFDVLFKGSNEPVTLHDANHPKYQGYNLFNMIVDKLCNNDTIRVNNINILLDHEDAKTVHQQSPDLFYPYRLDYLKMLINETDKKMSENSCYKKLDDDDVKHWKKYVEEARILVSININFNNYLKHIGFLGKNYKPTRKGFKFINGKLSRKFFKNTLINYHPDYPIPLLFKFFRHALGNTYEIGKKYKEYGFDLYYGLSFFINMADFDVYRRFCSFTDEYGCKRTLATSPLTYLTCILVIFDKIFNPKEVEPSKYCSKLLDQMEQLDALSLDTDPKFSDDKRVDKFNREHSQQ